VTASVDRDRAGRDHRADAIDDFALGDGRTGFAVVVARGRVRASGDVGILAVRVARLRAGRTAVAASINVSLSDMTDRPLRPIWLSELDEMPLAALAEPATQTSAATNVERITLLILGVVSIKKKERGGPGVSTL